jgi:Transcriptional regulatory protein, C terminal
MGKGSGLLRSLEGVAATLSAPLPADRAAAAACDAAAEALGAPVLVATPGESGRRVRAVHAGALPERDSVTALPIPSAGRQLGMLLVGRRRLGDEERAYLNVLAALLGLALARLPAPPGSHLFVGDIDIDLAEQRVVVGGRDARLTLSEIRLLAFLAAHPGRARTRREILGHLWHSDHVGDLRACDAHIANLRRKIERDPSRPERVVTVRSVGYALRPGVRM